MVNLKLGSFVIPCPSWVAPFFGVIAVVGLGFGVYRFYNPIEPELITVRKANETLKMELDEYNRHIMEDPAASFTDQSTKVIIRIFEDGCLLVSRRQVTRLLLDSSFRRSSVGLGFEAVLEASEQNRCLNPHPGRFQAAQGQRVDRCWMEVWRNFEDGCQHVQMFNTCTNGWATNPDGTPQVRWTRCVH
jgi:hypothetical protein